MLEIFIEALFEILVQFLLELGVHTLVEPFGINRDAKPLVSFFGYVLLGALAGWISLLLFPSNFIRDPSFQVINLLITPTLLGVFFAWFGRLREKKGMQLFGLDRFAYGFVFAFVVGVVRFKFAA